MVLIRHFIKRCIYHLHYNPWTTNILLTGAGMAVGDFIAQYFVENKTTLAQYDKRRTLSFGVAGLVVVAPSTITWIKFLERIFMNSPTAFIRKVVADQIFFAPYILAACICSLDILNSKSRKQIEERFKNEYTDVLLDAYKFWPIAQTINFALIPFVYRVFYLRFASMIWNTYLSWRINRSANMLPAN